tara:strand:- start:313 stop:609 length:297 start_codon:yes stop_codon:yes gene_type:complete
MELSKLSQKPQLLSVVIDKPELVEKYGDELEFFIYDRQSLDVFAKLANADQSNMGGLSDILKDMILDKDGNQIIVDENVLPLDVMLEAVTKVGERLGK